MSSGQSETADLNTVNSDDERETTIDRSDGQPFNGSVPKSSPLASYVPSEAIPRITGSMSVPVLHWSDSKYYNMQGKSRGKVLIFNQQEFVNKRYLPRDGTDRDVERLYNTLPVLGFKQQDISVYQDLKKADIDATVQILAADSSLYDDDCLIVIILTHGETDDYVMAYDKQYHLYEFINKFTPTVLGSMAGKPKLFIVQACRGQQMDPGFAMLSSVMQRDSVGLEDFADAQTNIQILPEFGDLLLVMSSHHGHTSFRNKDGSWLIQALCDAIEQSDVESDSVYDILTETNRLVSGKISNAEGELDRKKQASSFYSTLNKRLYFRTTEHD